jgi:hypothetical protein
MATLAQLRATVQDDLLAVPIATTDAHVNEAIKAAIRNYEADRFWFNETRSLTFSCVVGQTDYDSDDDIGLIEHADYMENQLDGADRWMGYARPPTLAWLIGGDASSGEPYLWTHVGGAIRLFPAPDDTYTIRVTGFIRYAPLVVDTDENPWTIEGKGYDLIRARARWHIANNVVKDEAEAGRAAQAEEAALIAAFKKTGARSSRYYVLPRQF